MRDLENTSQIYDNVMDSTMNVDRTCDYGETKADLRIDDYKLNCDASPLVINKKHGQSVTYDQMHAVRYLRPPTPPVPGEVIINQEADMVTKAAPPLVIRQVPARPATPEPLVIREAPPTPPQPVPVTIIRVSGKYTLFLTEN